MTNNDVLRRIRYILDLNDNRMIELFASGDCATDRSEISSFLKKEEDDDYKNCSDVKLASFLNGLITDRRGAKDGPKPVPEKSITNNIIFIKLRIAFNLKAEDVMEILSLADFGISNHELSAFFRRADHKHYRECKDQVLRNFLKGLQIKYRPD